MVERQTENLKVESSILFTDIIINKYLIPYYIHKLNINNQITYSKQQLKYTTHNFSKNIFLVNVNNKPVYRDYLAYQQFNTYYLRNLYDINLIEKNVNSLKLLPKKLIKHTLFKTKHKHYKNFNIKYFNEIAYMFLISV